MEVNWRGETYRFGPQDRPIVGHETQTLGRVCLWPPTSDPALPYTRDGWIADVLIRGSGFTEATGSTAQAALDALAGELARLPN